MIHDEMIVLVMIESIFSIVPIRKCRRTSVLVHGTKWCTIRRFYAVRLHLRNLSTRGGTFSVCLYVHVLSTTRLAVRERIWNESRTDISVNDGEGQLSCVGVWF